MPAQWFFVLSPTGLMTIIYHLTTLGAFRQIILNFYAYMNCMMSIQWHWNCHRTWKFNSCFQNLLFDIILSQSFYLTSTQPIIMYPILMLLSTLLFFSWIPNIYFDEGFSAPFLLYLVRFQMCWFINCIGSDVKRESISSCRCSIMAKIVTTSQVCTVVCTAELWGDACAHRGTTCCSGCH